MKILVLNAGSSTYKAALYDTDGGSLCDPKPPLWQGNIDYTTPQFSDPKAIEAYFNLETAVQDDKVMQDFELESLLMGGDHSQKVKAPPIKSDSGSKDCVNLSSSTAVSRFNESLKGSGPDLIAHRVVHGGDRFVNPTLINADVKKAIADLIPLAPLHNPVNLQGIVLFEKMFPHIPQVAVFDTAFHSTLSDEAKLYPGPYAWKEQGIKRYGFHGINYEYCTARAAKLLGKDSSQLKLVCCHLGNGASMAAISGGKSIDTTMGFTPLDGLMMGSRSGAIDPSIVAYLHKEAGQPVYAIYDTLNEASGLLGISGKTHDMRRIHELIDSGDARAKLAFDMYVHSIKRYLGAMIAVLGGVDAIIFTAGIGEHDAKLRSEVCSALSWIGVELDETKNKGCSSDCTMSTPASKVSVLVIEAQEDWCMAIQSLRLIDRS